MGAAHQLNKLIPHLAQICTPFRPGLKKFVYTPDMQLALTRLKQAVMHVTQNKFFDSRADTRINATLVRKVWGLCWNNVKIVLLCQLLSRQDF